MKKTKNKIICIIIAVISIMSILTIIGYNKSKAATITVDGLTWTYTVSNGNAIDVYVSNGTPGERLTIPETLGGYTVTGIRGSTYISSANILNSRNANTTVKEVVIPNTVTSIGNYTFYRFNALEEITIPNSVNTISDYAFYQCSNLKAVNFGTGVESINYYAFGYCSKLSSISLPNNINKIGQRAFYATGISGKLIIPESTKTIESYAFYNCSKLSELELNEGLTSIGSSAFYNCTGLKGDLIIPNSVTSLASAAFQNCSGFDGNLIVGNGVTSILGQTFNGCNNFKKITIGTSITSIGAYAFPKISDIWIKNIQSNVSINASFAGNDSNVFIHWLDDTHNVKISTVPGVKLVRTDTNEILTTGEYMCESNFDYKVEIENGYTYDNLKLVIVDNEDYDNYSSEDVDFNKNYSFSNLIRNREIYVQNFNGGLDLSLRTFITEINRKAIFPSRTPVVRTIDGKIQYLHTKYPVTVKTGDLITYRIRVYNESATTGTANIVKIYIPEGLELDTTNRTNINNKWTGNGNAFQTSILASKEIKKYSGNGRPNYEDIEVALKVTQEKNDEEDTRLNIIAEIAESSDTDVDATNGSIHSAVSSDYKKQESYNSNSNSYIPGQEDDDDFENVVIIGKIKVDYGIKITKIDADTNELLKGATFNLLDENEQVIKEATTDENGLLDFGTLTSYGEGEDIYYIEEAKTPEGYIAVQDKKLKVTVVKTIIDEDNGTYSVKVICESLDYNVDTTRYEFTPIKTKEQLTKIGSGETIEIDGVQYEYNANTNYKLMEDIDLAGENWTPISKNLKCIIDGNNHKISNLTIIENDEIDISEVGLFGDFSGIIQNLELENVNISVKNFSDDAESVTGYTGIGAFAGVMNEGFIINCKVSGNITGGCDNIGGFVGHTAKGKIVKIQKSTNNANVSSVTVDITENSRIRTVGGKNAGGFVGCALGAISVTDSTNEGNIQAVLYNAGGIVGYTEATEYSESDIIADFDEGDKTINLIVENKNVKGRYVIYLQNTDATTLGLIPGGVYKVLDKNKNEIQGLENVTLDTGKIELTSVDINTLGTDVYYIKEVNPASGYEKLNSYIKLSVTRYWDENLKDYRVTIGKDFVDNDEINTDDPKDSEEGLPSKTGDIFTKVDFVNPTWNSNKAEFKYCTNSGNIRAEYMNAAGIVGNSHCIVDINSCNNTGEIYSTRKSGGIISELQTEKLIKFSNIKSCENTGIVTSGIEGNGYEGSAGGIVSNAIGNLKVIECNNKGDVTGHMNQATAGIVAHMIGELTVESCKNEGLIYAKNPSSYPNVNSIAGGIVGKNRINKYTYPDITKEKVILKINNCQNYGDVKSSCHLGGIVGLTCAEMVEISNCEVKNININDTAAGDKGGIVGFSSNNKIKITDCNVENVKIERLSQIHNTYGGTGGIIGCVNKYGDENTTNVDTIIVGNCNVINCTMQSIDKEVAGIIGSEGGIEVTTMNYIYDCNVKDCTILNKDVTSSYSSSGGIVGGSYQAGYEISNCLVENTNVSSTYDKTRSGNDCDVGGIIGVAHSAKALNINKCDVINSVVNNEACPSDSCANAGGIVGYASISSYSQKEDLFQIIGCNVVDTELKTTAGNLSGIWACNYSDRYNAEVVVDGCIVNNCIITSTADTSSCTDTAGIVAYSYVNSEINNCKVLDTKITGDGRNTAGIFGYAHQNAKMNNIEVIRTDIKGTSIGTSTSTYSRDNDCVAGVLGGVNAEYNISNVKVDSCNLTAEYAGHGGNVAGIIGEAHNSNTGYAQLLKNCIVSNTNIISNAEISPRTSSNVTSAGLIGRADNANIINCNVTKCNISGKARIASGGIASANNLKAENCLVSDTEIKNEYKLWDLYQGYQIDRVVCGFVGSTYIAELDGIKVVDVTLLGNSESVGGVYGFINDLNKLSNITVEGLITNTHDIEHITNGASAGIGANTNLVNCVIENCKVTNSKINTNDHIASGMFGYIYGAAKLNNCNTDNITITHNNTFNSKYDPAVAGLIGLNEGKVEVINSSVKNGNIISRNGTKSSIHTGGLIGFIAGDTIVDTVNIINTNIENNSASGITGGIAGMTNYNIANNIIKTLTIKNSKIENCKNIVGNTHVGGILGFGKLIANNNSILETIIKSLGTFGDVGGIAGNTLDGTIIDGATANKITVLSQYRSGGIIGFSKANVKNANISNSSISVTGESAEAGGIVGLTTMQNSEILKCTADNVKVTSVNGYVGGIIGLANNQNIVKDCKAINSTVTATGDAPKGVGGIAGFGLIDTNIQNPTVSDNIITGNAMTGDIVGAPVTVNVENNVAEISDRAVSADNGTLQNSVILNANKIERTENEKNEEVVNSENNDTSEELTNNADSEMENKLDGVDSEENTNGNNEKNTEEEKQELDNEVKTDITESEIVDDNLNNDSLLDNSTEISNEKIIRTR